MKMKKVLSFLTAAAMGASCMAGMSISASAAITTGSELKSYSTSTTFTFSAADEGELINDASTSYQELSSGLVFYPGGNAGKDDYKCRVEAADDEAGYTYRYVGYNGDKGKSVLAFKAEKAGTVSIKAKVTGESSRKARITTKAQNEFDLTTELQEYSTTVDANTTVWVSSRSTLTDVAIYEVKYTIEDDLSSESGDPKVTLNKSKLELTVGGTEQLTANKENADESDIDWKSSNEDVATVDKDGNVTALKEGEADITATVTVGDKGSEAACKVIVTDPSEETETKTLQAVTEAKTWDISSLEAKAYETTTVLDTDNSIKLNVEAANKAITIESGKIKLGGSGAAAADKRNVEILPGVAGTLEIEFEHASPSKDETRTLAAEQSGDKTEVAVDSTTTTNTIKKSVVADASVYIYSEKSGINITSIKFTPGTAVVETLPEVTVDQTAVTTSTDKAGKLAAAYKATFTTNSISPKSITWTVQNPNKPEQTASNTAAIEAGLGSNTEIVCGLVVLTDDLSKIGTITAELN